MTPETAIAEIPVPLAAPRHPVTSFDSGYEHSLEHLIQVRELVEEADQDNELGAEYLKASA